MIVMVSNNTGRKARELAAKYPGRVGHLFSPGGQRGPMDGFPYALDNGAFSEYMGKPWSWKDWVSLMEWAADKEPAPLWSAVPDRVGDPLGTMNRWFAHSFRVARFGYTEAFVAQDGMLPRDVPHGVEVVFIGGTTSWKRENTWRFVDAGYRVHVGRVNGYDHLDECRRLGVESCDGTGWFRGDRVQLARLERFLKEGTAHDASWQRRLFE